VSELAALSSTQAGARGGLLVVPLGATEQHGPHLPLGTDTTIALALATRLAARSAAALTVAPVLPYGSSGEHQGFAGTVSIGQRALETVVVELVRSATETFGRVLLLSAHGGNAAPLRRAVAQLQTEARDVRAWSPAGAWRAPDGDAHAGYIETSVMLALAPETVAMDRARAGNTAPLETLMGAMGGGGVQAVSPNGVLGDPAAATGQAGRELLEQAVGELCAFVAGWPRGGDGAP
jgi:mycofactocin system creatininase family protein